MGAAAGLLRLQGLQWSLYALWWKWQKGGALSDIAGFAPTTFHALGARLAADQGFQDALQLYGTMKPKQVKEVFATLPDDVVVRYLRAMESRDASKVIKEFKSPAELVRLWRASGAARIWLAVAIAVFGRTVAVLVNVKAELRIRLQPLQRAADPHASAVRRHGEHARVRLGLAQALALIPGVSRSGISMSAALFAGLDRAEVRSRNLITPDRMPYPKKLKNRSGAELIIDGGDYPKCQALGLERIGYADFPARQQAARAQGRYLGIGFAHAVKPTGRGPYEMARVRVSPSGRINVYAAAMEMGQGIRTSLAQVCAEQLSVPLDAVEVTAGDSAYIPAGFGNATWRFGATPRIRRPKPRFSRTVM